MLAWKKPNLTIRNLHHGYIYRYIGKTVIKHDINCMGGGGGGREGGNHPSSIRAGVSVKNNNLTIRNLHLGYI